VEELLFTWPGGEFYIIQKKNTNSYTRFQTIRAVKCQHVSYIPISVSD
jgi:hypothetical protein